MSDTWTQAGDSPDALLARWRRDGRPADLAALFDVTGPELFRLALHLCPDAATAEDVLQETFVVVLERAKAWDPERPAMPWLVGILKNQALMARRRAARSPDPDRSPAPASPLDPAFEAAEAEERERLREVLKGLPEPYRGVALLRWRYGLEPAAIAEVQGVPPATVRTWLHRALARIKVTMVTLPALLLVLRPERGLDGVRAAILRRAVTRRLPESAEVVASGSVVVRALAGVPVGRALLAASIAVAAVGSAGWYLFGGGEGAGDSVGVRVPLQVASAPPAPKAPEAAPAPPATAAAAAAPVAVSPKPAIEGAELEILVLDAAGRPAPDAEVTYCRPADAPGYTRFQVLLSTESFPGAVYAKPVRTDAEGRAHLRLGKGDLALQAREKHFLHAVLGGAAALVELEKLPEGARVRKEVNLEPGVTISGLVRRREGDFVNGALALLEWGEGECHLVRTGEGGRFTLPSVPVSRMGRARLYVLAEGALQHDRWIYRKDWSGPDQEIVLAPVWTLRGRCVDASGVPLPGLPIQVDVETPLAAPARRTATTGDDGTFALEGIDGPRCTLTVMGGVLGLRTVPMLGAITKSGLDLGDVVLAGSREILGLVVREDGTPEPGALVLLLPYPSVAGPVLARTVTDGAGSFSFAVADDGGRQAGLIEYKDGKRYALWVLPGGQKLAAEYASQGDEERQNQLLFNDAQTRGYSRVPVGAGDATLRVVLGGLRARFRLLDADTGKPALLRKAKATARSRERGGTRSRYHDRLVPSEPDLHVDFSEPDTWLLEVEAEGYEVECPSSFEVTEARETVVEVKVRKKQ